MDREEDTPLLRQRPVRAAAAAANKAFVSIKEECKEDDPSCCDKVKGCLFGKKEKKGGKTRRRIKRHHYKKRNKTRRR